MATEPIPFPRGPRPGKRAEKYAPKYALPEPDPDNLDRALALLDEIGGALATVALLLMAEQEARGDDG